MSTFVAVGAVLVALVLGGACFVLANRLRAMTAQAAALEAAGAADPSPLPPVDLERTLGSGDRRVLVVEILNPVELATTRFPAAKLVGAVRPGLVSKIVYDQAAKQVVAQLAKEGVHADVRVHLAR